MCAVMQEYGDERFQLGRIEGREEGQSELAEAIKLLRAGKAPEQLLVMGYNKRTVDPAVVCR